MEGVLLTMFDGRTNLSIQVVEEVKKHFPGEVFSAVVPRNVRLSEAPSHGKPITAYDRMCRGAEAYLALADEILKKMNRREKLMAGAKMGLGGGLSNLFGSDTSDLMEESLDNGTKKPAFGKNRAESRSAEEGL